MADSVNLPTMRKHQPDTCRSFDRIMRFQSTASSLPNPFIGEKHIHLSTYQKFKIAVMTVTVFPVRLILGILLLIFAWNLAVLGLACLSREDYTKKALTGWRRMMKNVACLLVRLAFAVYGFHWVNVKGRRASAKEAPILILVPHTSHFDTLAVVCLGAPTVVAKAGARETPFFGKLLDFIQTIYVDRGDRNSKQTVVKEMLRRSHSVDDWTQILIFPESTTTNGTSIIKFKLGSFYPGLPVQPVSIKYKNKLDTITSTWTGVDNYQLLWLTGCQFHIHCELEFLPVYVPSDEEKKDPSLFALNVRQAVSQALGIPVSDYTYEDACSLAKEKPNEGTPVFSCSDSDQHEFMTETNVKQTVNKHEEDASGNAVKSKSD